MATHPKATPAKTPSLKKEFLIFVSIPVTMIVLVAGLLFIPSALAKPKYGFLYATCPDYSCANAYYTTGEGKIVESQDASTYYVGDRSRAELYIHDVMTNSSHKVDLATARNLKLDTANVSPDGYTLKWVDSSGSFLFFDSSSASHWYLEKGVAKKQMNVVGDSYDSHSITMLGWIE